MFQAIAESERQEEMEHVGEDLPELGNAAQITSEQLVEAVEKLEKKLTEKPKDKPLKKAVRAIRQDLLPRLQKYEKQRKILGDRNSFSKTDPDATFMRMKEDHMRNG
ncbi:ribosome recycling factor, partial [Cohnella thailandensis]|nr:ribosome recycling factor [Cohnella thailandensis]